MKEKLVTSKTNFIEKASLLLEHKLALATGVPREELPLNPDMLDSSYTPKLLDELFPMLQAVQVNAKIEAETTKDVIALIGKGKISMTEALQLINIIKAADPENAANAEDSNKIIIEIAQGGAT